MFLIVPNTLPVINALSIIGTKKAALCQLEIISAQWKSPHPPPIRHWILSFLDVVYLDMSPSLIHAVTERNIGAPLLIHRKDFCDFTSGCSSGGRVGRQLIEGVCGLILGVSCLNIEVSLSKKWNHKSLPIFVYAQNQVCSAVSPL